MVVHNKVGKATAVSLMLRLGDLGLLPSFVPIQLPQFAKAETYIDEVSYLLQYLNY